MSAPEDRSGVVVDDVEETAAYLHRHPPFAAAVDAERRRLAIGAEVEVRDRALASARELILDSHGFVCIYKRPADPSGRRYGGYCDDCPVSLGLSHGDSRLVCTLSRNYSQ